MQMTAAYRIVLPARLTKEFSLRSHDPPFPRDVVKEELLMGRIAETEQCKMFNTDEAMRFRAT